MSGYEEAVVNSSHANLAETTETGNILVVNGLRKFFPVLGGILNRTVAEVKAVDDISFSVRTGEVLGIVGESGCGKSTTARLLMHLIPSDAGTIAFDGQTVGGGLELREMRRQMQMGPHPRCCCPLLAASALLPQPPDGRLASPAPWDRLPAAQ